MRRRMLAGLILLTIAVGVGSGYVVGQAALHGKIRNISVVGGIALLAALAGIYAEWGATIYAMYPASELPQLWAKAGLKPFLGLRQNLAGAIERGNHFDGKVRRAVKESTHSAGWNPLGPDESDIRAANRPALTS